MRLPGRKKTADQDITAVGPAPAPLAPSIAANVLPGVPLPGWAVYTLQANAAGGPQAPPVGAGWGAADPGYAGGSDFSESADPDLEAGAYAVAQTSVLAAWEASWEWQQDAGPSPEDLVREAEHGAPVPDELVGPPVNPWEAAGTVQPESATTEDASEELAALLDQVEGEEPDAAPPSAALPDSGLDIPVAEPEFLVDQPSVEEAQEFGLTLDEDGFPVVEEQYGQTEGHGLAPESSAPGADHGNGAAPVADEEPAVPVTDYEDSVPVVGDDDPVIPVADYQDSLPVPDNDDPAIPVADYEDDAMAGANEPADVVPIYDDEFGAPGGTAGVGETPGFGHSDLAADAAAHDESDLMIGDGDADVDMDPAVAASAPPSSWEPPGQDAPSADNLGATGDSPDLAAGSAGAWTEPESAGAATDAEPPSVPGSPPDEVEPADPATRWASIPTADEPVLAATGVDEWPVGISESAATDAAPEETGGQDAAASSDAQVDEDLWQALALAAEEAGGGGASATESDQGGEEPNDSNPN